MLTTVITTTGYLGRTYLKGQDEEVQRLIKTKILTGLALVFNIAVSIGIVLTNKWLYSIVKFPNMTLTFMHFVTTFICLHLCQMLGVFQVKRVSLKSMIPLALCFCGFVVLTNLSLESNSVGTYQVAKVMTTPCVLIIQYYIYGKLTSTAAVLTVVSLLKKWP